MGLEETVMQTELAAMQSHTHAPRYMCAHHTHIKIKLFTLKRGRERMFALNTTRSENLEEKETNGVFP